MAARHGAGVDVARGSLTMRLCTVRGAQYGSVIEAASGRIEDCQIGDIVDDGSSSGSAPIR